MAKLIASSISVSVTPLSNDLIPELPVGPENGRSATNYAGMLTQYPTVFLESRLVVPEMLLDLDYIIP